MKVGLGLPSIPEIWFWQHCWFYKIVVFWWSYILTLCIVVCVFWWSCILTICIVVCMLHSMQCILGITLYALYSRHRTISIQCIIYIIVSVNISLCIVFNAFCFYGFYSILRIPCKAQWVFILQRTHIIWNVLYHSVSGLWRINGHFLKKIFGKQSFINLSLKVHNTKDTYITLKDHEHLP